MSESERSCGKTPSRTIAESGVAQTQLSGLFTFIPSSMNPKGQKERKDGKKGVTKYRKMERRGEVWGGPTLQHCLLLCSVKGRNKTLPL